MRKMISTIVLSVVVVLFLGQNTSAVTGYPSQAQFYLSGAWTRAVAGFQSDYYSFSGDPFLQGVRTVAGVNLETVGENFVGTWKIDFDIGMAPSNSDPNFHIANYTNTVRNSFPGNFVCGLSGNFYDTSTTSSFSSSVTGWDVYAYNNLIRISAEMSFYGVTNNSQSTTNAWCQSLPTNSSMLMAQPINGTASISWYPISSAISITSSSNPTDAIYEQMLNDNRNTQSIIESISNQQQAEQDRYDQEKAEEAEREQDLQNSSSEGAGIFDFSILNPLSNLQFNNGCVLIPIIADWLHLQNPSVCPFFPQNVRDGISPIIGVFVTIITFTFLWRLLGGFVSDNTKYGGK